MKVRAQIAMVLNLDKCIGCHTCSVTCKQVWTSREGVEYAWFNNVETKPGIGYPKDWENQDRWKGGWKRKRNGTLRAAHRLPPAGAGEHLRQPRHAADRRLLRALHLRLRAPAVRGRVEGDADRASRLAHHRRADGEDRVGAELGGDPWRRVLEAVKDRNFEAVQKDIYGQFEQTFMMYLPRLCEHCLNPACVAACPSGTIYKREEDGIVLVDQDKCRGWRMCVSACPYKKIYYNWQSGKAEKCTFCFPRIEAGEPTVCSETCVGRIRYLGVMLYDADRIEEAASVENEQQLYRSQLDIFLDPSDPAGDRAGARGWRARAMAGSRPQVAGLQDGNRMGRRLPAAPGIPDPADGLVRAAAVPGAVGARGGTCRLGPGAAGREIAPHPRALPGQPADRGGRGAGGAGPASA